MSAVRQGELHLGVGVALPAPPPAAHEDDRLCPFCALCGLTAKAWSGVEEWMVAGQWIGWCSNECRRRWLKGEKSAGSQPFVERVLSKGAQTR